MPLLIACIKTKFDRLNTNSPEMKWAVMRLKISISPYIIKLLKAFVSFRWILYSKSIHFSDTGIALDQFFDMYFWNSIFFIFSLVVFALFVHCLIALWDLGRYFPICFSKFVAIHSSCFFSFIFILGQSWWVMFSKIAWFFNWVTIMNHLSTHLIAERCYFDHLYNKQIKAKNK